MLTRKCQTCLWWEKSKHFDVGDCRQRPPLRANTPQPDQDMSQRWWPVTRGDDWCAEYEPR